MQSCKTSRNKNLLTAFPLTLEGNQSSLLNDTLSPPISTIPTPLVDSSNEPESVSATIGRNICHSPPPC